MGRLLFSVCHPKTWFMCATSNRNRASGSEIDRERGSPGSKIGSWEGRSRWVGRASVCQPRPTTILIPWRSLPSTGATNELDCMLRNDYRKHGRYNNSNKINDYNSNNHNHNDRPGQPTALAHISPASRDTPKSPLCCPAQASPRLRHHPCPQCLLHRKTFSPRHYYRAGRCRPRI